jgi:hypothetical protein
MMGQGGGASARLVKEMANVRLLSLTLSSFEEERE